MAVTLSDYLQKALPSGLLQAVPNIWVQLTNNATSTAYVSSTATDASGKYTVIGIPAGTYTVATGPSNAGPWVSTGDAGYLVSDPAGGGGVTSVTAADPTVTVGGTAANPTLAVTQGASTIIADSYAGTDAQKLQSALNAALTAAQARAAAGLYASAKVYLSGREWALGNAALQTTNSRRAQVMVPYNSSGVSTVIEIVGEEGSTTISSTLSSSWDSVAGWPSMIGAAATVAQINALYEESTTLIVRGVIFKQPDNPTLACLDLRTLTSWRGEGLTAIVPGWGATQPTHPTGVGILPPQVQNSNNSSLDRYVALGFYGGLGLQEHLCGSNIHVAGCQVGLFTHGVIAPHAVSLEYVTAEKCPYVLAHIDPSSGYTSQPSGTVYNPYTTIVVSNLDIEDWVNGAGAGQSGSTSWQNLIAHVLDNNSTYQGFISYERGVSNSTVAPPDGLVLSGGYRIAYRSNRSGDTTITGHRVILGDPAPAIANGAGLGTSPPAPSIRGSDNAGEVSHGTGTAPANGLAVSVTFSKAYNSVPAVVITPDFMPAGGTAAFPYPLVVRRTTGFDIYNFNLAASQPNGTYKYSYQVTGL